MANSPNTTPPPYASSALAGIVSTIAQSFAGAKTFLSTVALTVNNYLYFSGTGGSARMRYDSTAAALVIETGSTPRVYFNDTGTTVNQGPVQFGAGSAAGQGGQVLSLKPAGDNHVYIGFYARTATPTTRNGYLGYPSSGSNNLLMVNETASGSIQLISNVNSSNSILMQTAGGSIALNAGAGVIDATGSRTIELGDNTDNVNVYLDLHGSSTYTDYSARFIRNTIGDTSLIHRGTGSLYLNASDAGSLRLQTNSTTRHDIDSSGNHTFSGGRMKFGNQPFVESDGGGQPFRHYRNLASYYSNSTVTGAIVIKTPLKRTVDNSMVRVHISGYTYDSDTAFDIQVGFYHYTPTPQFFYGGYTTTGSRSWQVRLAHDASDNVCIILDDVASSHNSLKLWVQDAMIHSTDETLSQGWTVTNTTSLTGYIDITNTADRSGAEWNNIRNKPDVTQYVTKTATGNIPFQGMLYYDASVLGLNWNKGLRVIAQGGDYNAGVGFTGNGDTITSAYLAVGTDPADVPGNPGIGLEVNIDGTLKYAGQTVLHRGLDFPALNVGDRHEKNWIVGPTGPLVSSHGLAVTSSQTPSAVTVSGYTGAQYTTTNVSGNAQGVYVQVMQVTSGLNWASASPAFRVALRTGSDVTSMRIWVVLTSNTSLSSATSFNSQTAAGFLYDSSVATDWRVASNNGSGTATVVPSGATVTAGNTYTLTMNRAGSFYINSDTTSFATLGVGSILGSASPNMYLYVYVVTTNTTPKSILLRGMSFSSM